MQTSTILLWMLYASAGIVYFDLFVELIIFVFPDIHIFGERLSSSELRRRISDVAAVGAALVLFLFVATAIAFAGVYPHPQ